MISPEIARQVPARHRNTLDRPHLLHAMQRPAALVVVSGPAGSGKSTLLAEWLRSRENDAIVLWVSLRGVQLSERELWLPLLAQLHEALARSSSSAVHPGTEVHSSSSDETLRDAVRRATHLIERPVVVAIDNAHAFSPDAIREIVDLLAVTASLTIGVATHSRSPFHSTGTRMAVDTVFIHGSQLEFTGAEITALLSASGLPNDDATVRLVCDATGGHARASRAALMALASSRRLGLNDLRQIVLNSLGWNQIRQHTFAHDEPILSEFLVRSSVLEEVPLAYAEDLAAAIVHERGEAPSARFAATFLLARAEKLSIGTVVGIGAEQRFRLLSISRNALLATLDARPREEVWAARARAAQWLVRNDALEEGFLLAIAGRDYDTAEFAGARRFTRLVGFNAEAVRQALASVPVLTLGKHPLLALMLGLSYNLVPRLRLRAIEYFGIAIVGAKRARPHMGATERVVLDTVMSGALRITGQSESAARVARRALKELSSLTESELGELGTIVDAVTVQSGISLLYAGDLEAALSAFRQSSAPEDSPHSLHALAALAGTHAVLGEMREVAELLAEGNARDWPEGWIDGYQGSLFQLARAALALEAFDLETAQSAVSSIDEHITTIEHWPLFAEVQAYIDLFALRAEMGSDRLQSARRRKRGRVDIDAGSRRRLAIAASTLHLAAGRMRQAESALHGFAPNDAAILVARARLLLVSDAPDAAFALLIEASDMAASERVRAEQLAVECAVVLRLGRSEAAVLALERLSSLLDFAELRTPLALLPAEDLEALRSLAARQSSHDVVQLLSQRIPQPLHRHSAIVLSERERVVLRALVNTGSAAEIADSLFVSVNTVKSQLRSLYRKLGVSAREDALVVAAAQRLLESASPIVASDSASDGSSL